MEKIRTMGIRELKNNLSSVVREVAGKRITILVTDRDVVVAELAPPATYLSQRTLHPREVELLGKGLLRLPVAERQTTPRSPVRRPAGTASRLLDEERGE